MVSSESEPITLHSTSLLVSCVICLCDKTRWYLWMMTIISRRSVSHPHITWWRHQMEKFSAWLAICAGNSPVPGEVPAQRPVTRNFDVFFDLRLNKRLSKQSWGWWFETLSSPLWRHGNESSRTSRTSIVCYSTDSKVLLAHMVHHDSMAKKVASHVGMNSVVFWWFPISQDGFLQNQLHSGLGPCEQLDVYMQGHVNVEETPIKKLSLWNVRVCIKNHFAQLSF